MPIDLPGALSNGLDGASPLALLVSVIPLLRLT
jgi:hypothetical protein